MFRGVMSNYMVPEPIGSATAPDPLSLAFGALADPTRRAILSRLARGEASVAELAAPFDMSVRAVSKHIGVLQRAGLVARGRDGQRRRAASWRHHCATRTTGSKTIAASGKDASAAWTRCSKGFNAEIPMRPAEERGAAPREFSITRIFDAPRELIFRLWTDPRYVEQWWGVEDATNPQRGRRTSN